MEASSEQGEGLCTSGSAQEEEERSGWFIAVTSITDEAEPADLSVSIDCFCLVF